MESVLYDCQVRLITDNLGIIITLKSWIYKSVKFTDLLIYAYRLLQEEINTSETQTLCEQPPDNKLKPPLNKSIAALCLHIKQD